MIYKLLFLLSFISFATFAQVDLGDDINACQGDIVTIDATTVNATTYQWYLNNSVINGETLATLDITENGTYKVIVNVTGTTYQDEVNAVFNPLPDSDYIAFYACDNDAINDGFTSLNLSDYAEYATTDITTHSVNFYLSMADATNNINPITAPYTNITNPQTFFTRVENTTTGCFTISELIIDIYINPTSLDALSICETDGNGLEEFDLNNVNVTAIDTISFYAALTDAENETNPISTNYTNITNPQTIYAKITNNIDCTYIATVELEVFDQPIITTPSDLEDCHIEYDGYVPFNLSTKNAEILNGLDTNTYQLTYHTTQYSANTGNSPLYQNPHYTDENETLYVRVENTITGCFTTTTINLLIIQEQITTPTHLSICDSDNNGFETFDLTTKSAEILNGSNSSLIFYSNYYEAQNNTNPITNPSSYTNISTNQTVYAKAQNMDNCFSNIINFQLRFTNPVINLSDVTMCFTESSFIFNPGFNPTLYDLVWTDDNNNTLSTANILVVTEAGMYHLTVTEEATGCTSTQTMTVLTTQPFTVATPIPLEECIDDTTGMALFDLASVESQLGVSLSEYGISYHESEDYALANISSIANPTIYSSDTSNLYFSAISIRVVSLIDGCVIIVPLVLNALDCNDEDSDGVINSDEDTNGNGILTDDDTDTDGTPNYLDSDDDGDSVPTSIEINVILLKSSHPFVDTDNNLIENYLDNDDDGDGVLTINEDYNNNGDPTDDDVNNNSIPDYLDANVTLSVSNFIANNFNVYPNPATTVINIDFAAFISKNMRVSIYNLQGQLILKELVLNSKKTSIPLTHLKSGLYFLNFKSDNGSFTKKLIIK